MISQKSRYALKAVVELAKRDRGIPVSSSELAASTGIPSRSLDTILQELKRQGLIVSFRGNSRGYILAHDPRELTIGTVLKVTEGPMEPLHCLSQIAYRRCDDCESEVDCEVRKVLSGLENAMRTALDNTSIADGFDRAVRKNLRLT